MLKLQAHFQITDYQRHKDIYQHAILFEDVIADPEREIKKIFDLMDIGHEHVPGALESLKEDSQRGTFGPRGKRPKGWTLHDVHRICCFMAVSLPSLHNS